jgi:hypothetical protein
MCGGNAAQSDFLCCFENGSLRTDHLPKIAMLPSELMIAYQNCLSFFDVQLLLNHRGYDKRRAQGIVIPGACRGGPTMDQRGHYMPYMVILQVLRSRTIMTSMTTTASKSVQAPFDYRRLISLFFFSRIQIVHSGRTSACAQSFRVAIFPRGLPSTIPLLDGLHIH